MKQTKTTPIILTAAKGKYLTQAADVDIFGRILTTSITLAVNDSPDNWREISADEANAINAEKERAVKERMESGKS